MFLPMRASVSIGILYRWEDLNDAWEEALHFFSNTVHRIETSGTLRRRNCSIKLPSIQHDWLKCILPFSVYIRSFLRQSTTSVANRKAVLFLLFEKENGTNESGKQKKIVHCRPLHCSIAEICVATPQASVATIRLLTGWGNPAYCPSIGDRWFLSHGHDTKTSIEMKIILPYTNIRRGWGLSLWRHRRCWMDYCNRCTDSKWDLRQPSSTLGQRRRCSSIILAFLLVVGQSLSDIQPTDEQTTENRQISKSSHDFDTEWMRSNSRVSGFYMRIIQAKKEGHRICAMVNWGWLLIVDLQALIAVATYYNNLKSDDKRIDER